MVLEMSSPGATRQFAGDIHRAVHDCTETIVATNLSDQSSPVKLLLRDSSITDNSCSSDSHTVKTAASLSATALPSDILSQKPLCGIGSLLNNLMETARSVLASQPDNGATQSNLDIPNCVTDTQTLKRKKHLRKKKPHIPSDTYRDHTQYMPANSSTHDTRTDLGCNNHWRATSIYSTDASFLTVTPGAEENPVGWDSISISDANQRTDIHKLLTEDRSENAQVILSQLS